MKTLYIDCGMGCAGDMLTAALLELHPDGAQFLERMNAVLAGRAVITCANVEKCGISCTQVTVLIDGESEETASHSHHHHGRHHSHTSVKDIVAFIDSLELPEEAKSSAKDVYTLIARAEGHVHGREIEDIHFHEVGSIDALTDVLSVCCLMHELAPDRVLASAVNVGSGKVKCAHGLLPVPAPATELLLRGVPIYSGAVQSELCTPTGAALLCRFVQDFAPMPVMRVAKAGYGAGKKDFEAANFLRALLGDSEEPEHCHEHANGCAHTHA